MAITPSVFDAWRQASALNVTSTAADVAANDLLVVVVVSNQSQGGALTVTLTDNQGGLAWQTAAATPFISRDDAAGQPSFAGAWWYKSAGSITGLTVTATQSGGQASAGMAIKIFKVTGNVSGSDPIGASTSGDLTTDPQTTGSITPETSGVGFAVWSDWSAGGVPTSSDLTMTGFDEGTDVSGGSGYKTLSAGVGATANIDSPATPQGNYVWFEIRDEGGGGGTDLSVGVGALGEPVIGGSTF